MKTTIIKILDKIANGEFIPRNIKFKGNIYVYDEKEQDYMSGSYGLFDEYCLISILNEEVELLDESKEDKIELLDIRNIRDCDDYQQIFINFRTTWYKINEIIEKIHKE